MVRCAALGLVLAAAACGGTPARPARANAYHGIAAPISASPGGIALTHANVIDVATGSLVPDRTIVLDGDRIVAIGDAAPPNAKVYDLHRKFVIPGLWDMHVHFHNAGQGLMFVANGVTGVRVMWGNPTIRGKTTDHFGMRKQFDAKELVGPRMVIASQVMDGPEKIWPNSLAIGSPDEGRRAVDDAKASGVDFVKVYSVLPRDTFLAIADESKKLGLPFAGHVPASVTVAEASDAGMKSMEHLTGMVIATSGQEDEIWKAARAKAKTTGEMLRVMHAQLANAEATYDKAHAQKLFDKLRTNGTHIVPTFTVHEAMATIDQHVHASDPRLAYVPRVVQNRWDPKNDIRLQTKTAADFEQMRRDLGHFVTIVHDMNESHVPLLAGTDEANPYCYAGFSLHDELGWMTKAGLTPLEALRTATLAPAQFYGMAERMGTVAEGKVADLVVLDADPRADIANVSHIAMVVSRGTVFERTELDEMLERLRKAVARLDPPGSR